MIAQLLLILAACLFWNASTIAVALAGEIRPAMLIPLGQEVGLAEQETFVLNSSGEGFAPACSGEKNSSEANCQLPVLHFGLNSAVLAATEKDRLLAALAQCQLSPKSRILVIGHSCSLGSKERNLVLSRKRADQVAGLLRSSGYSVAGVIGKGASEPVLEDSRLAGNRRVELTVLQP